ncbi:hypothetical protein LSH36_482g02065 [Paralvinella palmiformis]|uniref:L-Fucosyltransferase n=1 Tax=Paralvinella palmiformis TaxID=53620 RepID=A0AAD9J9P8_9ANNE|nr:hypothetical protein LSH36_482g02065 [Paralvinella palmiformis]
MSDYENRTDSMRKVKQYYEHYKETGRQQSVLHRDVRRFVLSVIRTGRLGNAMFEYSALYGLANLTNRIPVLNPDFRDLAAIFHLLVPVREKTLQLKVQYNQRDFVETYDVAETVRTLFALPVDVKLFGFFQYFRYFSHVDKEIRKQFTFRDSIQRRVRHFFSETFTKADESVKVGIHVRRTDLSMKNWISFGFGPPPASYFENAMNYFRKRYKNVRFILCSDDLLWSSQHIRAGDVTFVENRPPEVDMAILASCDHVIIGNGSFGWWVSWLCRGVTVRYKRIPEYNTYIYNATLGDHWPPEDDYNHYVVIDS